MMARMGALTATIWFAEGGHSNDEGCKIFDLGRKYASNLPLLAMSCAARFREIVADIAVL